MSIEELNFAQDSRNCGPDKPPVLYFYGCGTCGTHGESCDCPVVPDGMHPVAGVHFYGCDIEEPLPTTWVVCDVCNGDGKHVNPSIDCNGISPEVFLEDPDFAEDYSSGLYDQPCNKCRGRTTIQAVDWDALSAEQRTAYEAQLAEEADDRACYLAEMRMGA